MTSTFKSFFIRVMMFLLHHRYTHILHFCYTYSINGELARDVAEALLASPMKPGWRAPGNLPEIY